MEIDHYELPRHYAYFLGFILYELLTNTFKYAALDTIPDPLIIVRLIRTAPQKFKFNYQDNGVGLPNVLFDQEKFQLEKLDSLGFKIVDLITKIHQGEFWVSPPSNQQSGMGVQCVLNFAP